MSSQVAMANNPLPFLKEVFPSKTDQEIQTMIDLVLEDNSLNSYEQQVEVLCDMLSGGNDFLNLNAQNEDADGNDSEEEHEGAVGFGHNNRSTADIGRNFNTLQNIFPSASQTFLWNFCHQKGACFNLNEAIDELTRDGYELVNVDHNEIWERLKEALPEADPVYLERQAKKLVLEDPNNLEIFVNTALENNDYPTMKEYLKKKEQEDNLNFYREENFQLKQFMEIFPNPETHFSDPNRPNPLQDNSPEEDILCAKRFLYNKYPSIRKKHIDLVFKMKKMSLSQCCQHLDLVKDGLKTARTKEPLPSCGNIELLQLIAYINHQKLIHKMLKYKDETYKKFKEEARKLNLLETCTICAEDELIPEECLSCNKGCIFCKECVKKYVEIKLGDGLVKFPCCNDCDSEFSLHVLQLALPENLFARLLLKIQSEEIKQAQLDGLETCPFCDYAGIPFPDSKVFQCENRECGKESCRLCKHESHVPQRCNEIEYDEDVKRRTYIENMMTEALARTCYKCQKKFVKTSGCNKMTCTCGAMMCYLCSQAVTGYGHFGEGKQCQLLTADDQINLNRVKAKAEEAKRQLGNVEIKFDPSVGIENFFNAN